MIRFLLAGLCAGLLTAALVTIEDSSSSVGRAVFVVTLVLAVALAAVVTRGPGRAGLLATAAGAFAGLLVVACWVTVDRDADEVGVFVALLEGAGLAAIFGVPGVLLALGLERVLDRRPAQ
ncbi:MAG: hypothetical protein M0R74_04660 [Dehalococcoidia bacterium]|nr:hypothetical protein [Dehalococcoidia bacterium]